MSEDDTTVEPSADSAPEGAAAEAPVETPAEPSVETAADTTADSAPTTEDSGGSADTWTGELADVQGSEWFEALPGDVQGAVLAGLEAKYKNWQRGYNDKFQGLADSKKSLSDREEELKSKELRVQKWLYGEEDPISTLKQELDGLRTEKESIETKLREELEKAVSEAKAGGAVDLERLQAERDAAQSKLAEIESREAAAQEAQLDQEAGELDNWLQKNAPDLYKEYNDEALDKARDDAFLAFCKISMMGVEPEVALSMLRVQHPEIKVPGEPEKVEPEEVPASVDLMNMGTGSGGEAMGKGDVRSFDDIMDGLRRAAQQSAVS
tara:strand:+ start:7922 stop:8893 length:972 start_codon:yes stop_codon:yes gene_type:complete